MNRKNAARRNYLLRILSVQEEYKAHKVEGMADAFVYRKHIFPRFHICERTFRTYLGTPAARELKMMNALPDDQSTLF